MEDYIQIDMDIFSKEQSEIFVALLSEMNYDGFEENENLLSAFIKKELFDQIALDSILSPSKITYSKKKIESINWNQKWESEFLPVIVDDFVAIRAGFHQPVKNVEHEIIITPKMSFGTGHHSTTYLMIRQMKKLDFTSKSVLDFGTGTGVLAILAHKLGANKITAIDIDDWSIENARENFKANNCNDIDLYKRDGLFNVGQFDIVLANINLNIIISNKGQLRSAASSCGKILVSGFLKTDQKQLLNSFNENEFHCNCIKEKDGWLSVLFTNKE